MPANAAGLLEAADGSKRFTFYCGAIRFGRQLSKDGLPGSGMSDKYTKLIGAEISSPDPEDFKLVEEIVEGGYEVSYGEFRRACLLKADYQNDAWSGPENALSLLRKVIVTDAEIARAANKKAAEEEAKKNYVSWAEQQRQQAAGRAPTPPSTPSRASAPAAPTSDAPGPIFRSSGIVEFPEDRENEEPATTGGKKFTGLGSIMNQFQSARTAEQKEYEARPSWGAAKSAPEPAAAESAPQPAAESAFEPAAAESAPEPAAESAPEPAALKSTPEPAAEDGGGPSPLSGEALKGFVKSFPIFSVFGGNKGDD